MIDDYRKKWKINTLYENTFILVRELFTMIHKYNKNDIPAKSMYEKLVNTVWGRMKAKTLMIDSINLYSPYIKYELLIFRDV